LAGGAEEMGREPFWLAKSWFSGKLVEASQEGSTMARFSSVTVVLQASRERT
jgi:hypothetical protein